jgi:hypothetical protein
MRNSPCAIWQALTGICFSRNIFDAYRRTERVKGCLAGLAAAAFF